jgi:vacuolar-type H+-ATPase catalytic subunit A/Vma1
MYAIWQERSRNIIHDIEGQLNEMALDPRLMPGVACELRSVRSSASTPSLRSRDGSITPVGRMDPPGGNVRVAVRVRGFLPRGLLNSIQR